MRVPEDEPEELFDPGFPEPPSAEALTGMFRESFGRDPSGAFREWYVLEEHLRDSGDDALACRLADDLWVLAPGLAFAETAVRARFFHDLGVFFGNRGPAASLPRAVAALDIACSVWGETDAAAVGRALHNRGNALQNLGESAAHLREAIDCYEKALGIRTLESNSIAHAATLHAMATALRRLAELEPDEARLDLARAREVLGEALKVRSESDQPLGHALSRFHLGLVLGDLARLGEPEAREEALSSFSEAERIWGELGRGGEAELARLGARALVTG